MAQEIKFTDKTRLLIIFAISGLAALAAFIRGTTLKCDEIGCLINLFLSVPIGLAVGGLVFFVLLLALIHARGSKTNFLHFVLAFIFAFVLGVLASVLGSGTAGSVLSFIFFPITLYLKRVWLLLLLLLIGGAIVIRFVKMENFTNRFWMFVVLAGIIPALVSGISYPIVMKNLPQTEIEEVHAAWEAQASEQGRIIQLETQRITYLVESGDTAVCDTLQQMRDMCYSKFAESMGDPALCKKVKKADWKVECYEGAAYETKDSAVCDAMDNSYGTKQNVKNCKMAVEALRTNNPALCEGIMFAGYAGSPALPDTVGIRQCVSRIAVNTNNEQLCLHVNHELDKYKCISSIALVKDDLNLCQGVDAYYVGYCYSDFAIKQSDKTVCDNAQDTNVQVYDGRVTVIPKQQCLDRFFQQKALIMNDGSLCASIVDSQLRTICEYPFG